MASILFVYSSVYGQTRRICERLQLELARHGHTAELVPLGDPVEPARYDAIVIGASIRHGKHNPGVLDFIRTHRALLEQKPSGFFSVSLVARKPAKNTPETNPYLRAFLARSPWQPRLLQVFAGILDYQRYGLFDRNAIRFIMWLTGGPTDPTQTVEFTQWERVPLFADQIAALVAATGPR